MQQLINPKIILNDKGIPCLLDAPEEPDVVDGCDDTIEEQWENYERKLSKAPTWEIKNDILEVRAMFTERIIEGEQGKLYDIPTSYTYKIEEICPEQLCVLSGGCYADGMPDRKCLLKEFAILIPQQEVKGESQEDKEIKEIELMIWHGVRETCEENCHCHAECKKADEFIENYKSKFHLTRR